MPLTETAALTEQQEALSLNAEFIISTKLEKWKHVHHSGSALSVTYILFSVRAKTFLKIYLHYCKKEKLLEIQFLEKLVKVVLDMV